MDISDDETEKNLDTDVDEHRIIETYRLVLTTTLREVITAVQIIRIWKWKQNF